MRFDAAESAIAYETVTCEPLTSRELGSQTTCIGTGQLADYHLTIQVLPDGDDTPFVVVSVSPDLH